MPRQQLSCPVVAATPATQGHFVGFHDICPWASPHPRKAEDLLAVTRLPPGFDRVPQPGDRAEICLWRPATGSVEPMGETTAWNLQQGARLQWRPGHPNTLVWNVAAGDGFGAVVRDLERGTERRLDHPVHALHPDGRTALSPSYARLGAHYPGYGYAGGTAPDLDTVAPATDGLWRVDLETDEGRLLLSVAAAAELGEFRTDPPAPQFLTHPSWSPRGTRFCVIHRCFVPGGEMLSRLLVANADGTNLRLLSDDRVSHFDWLDEDTLCVWARIGLKPLGRLRRDRGLATALLGPLKRLAKALRPDLKLRLNKAGYWLLDVTGRTPPRLVVAHIEDGHQMFAPDRRWMVTDTYPDRHRRQTLMLFDLEAGRIVEIGRFAAPPHTLHELRCDLHPRWNRDGSRIAVDCDRAGVRQVLIVDPTPVLGAPAAPAGHRLVA